MTKKVLIAYFSQGGATESMAEYIAEGVRIAGYDAEVRKISAIKKGTDLAGYDGYVFGSPTYYSDIPETMKEFLLVAESADLEGKAGGAFSVSAHPGGGGREGTAGILFDRMESVFRMRMTNLGPFNLTEDLFDHPDAMRSCHDYGKAMGEML
jgi:flavodoxin